MSAPAAKSPLIAITHYTVTPEPKLTCAVDLSWDGFIILVVVVIIVMVSSFMFMTTWCARSDFSRGCCILFHLPRSEALAFSLQIFRRCSVVDILDPALFAAPDAEHGQTSQTWEGFAVTMYQTSSTNYAESAAQAKSPLIITESAANKIDVEKESWTPPRSTKYCNLQHFVKSPWQRRICRKCPPSTVIYSSLWNHHGSAGFAENVNSLSQTVTICRRIPYYEQLSFLLHFLTTNGYHFY